MKRLRFMFIAVCCGLLTTAAYAATPADPAALARNVDDQLRAIWQATGAEPAPPADDATFLRRAYLDLVGRVPTIAETRAFLEDAHADKRAKLILQLTSSGGHARHFATAWRRTWAPQTDTAEFDNLTEDMEAWAAVRLRDNVPYDKLVREMLTTPRLRAAKQRGSIEEQVTPVGFLASNQFRSENLAASTTRAFLGLNLDCAQCHDHPFARWTRDQFWETAAFFESPTADGKMPQILIPDTERKLSPQLLDKHAVQWPSDADADTGRAMLAEWVTSRDNPYFARNAVNRVWAQLFGTGLVEPLDDLSEDNPSPHPELLDSLANAFVASDFDLKYLTRALALTQAYQLATQSPNDVAMSDPTLFARMPIRGLAGEQLYDSLRVSAGLPARRVDLLTARDNGARQRFASQFGIERGIDAERSIVQALSLMNGTVTSELTDPEESPILITVATSPFLNSQDQVETLFLATLSRRPTNAESSRLVNYIESGGEERTRPQALADIFWSLLNSSEYNTNH